MSAPRVCTVIAGAAVFAWAVAACDSSSPRSCVICTDGVCKPCDPEPKPDAGPPPITRRAPTIVVENESGRGVIMDVRESERVIIHVDVRDGLRSIPLGPKVIDPPRDREYARGVASGDRREYYYDEGGNLGQAILVARDGTRSRIHAQTLAINDPPDLSYLLVGEGVVVVRADPGSGVLRAEAKDPGALAVIPYASSTPLCALDPHAHTSALDGMSGPYRIIEQSWNAQQCLEVTFEGGPVVSQHVSKIYIPQAAWPFAVNDIVTARKEIGGAGWPPRTETAVLSREGGPVLTFARPQFQIGATVVGDWSFRPGLETSCAFVDYVCGAVVGSDVWGRPSDASTPESRVLPRQPIRLAADTTGWLLSTSVAALGRQSCPTILNPFYLEDSSYSLLTEVVGGWFELVALRAPPN